MDVKKVLLVTNIPNAYRIPLFNELNIKFKSKGIIFKVAFGAATYSRRKFKLNAEEMQFDYAILSSKTFHLGNNEKTIFTYTGLTGIIKDFKPDKIIVSGFSLGTLKVWLWSLFNNTPFIIWSGSILQNNGHSFIRQLQRNFLYKKACGFIAYGTKAKKYLIAHGVSPDKISIAINTVETEFFESETKKLRALHVPDEKKHLLYIGYLVYRKNLIQLLEIIKLLWQQRKDFVLDIIGDGEQKAQLEDFVRLNNLQQCVVFHGFRQKNELPLYLAKSTCFLFHTNFDIWGLVLSEAMAAGIPCIASLNAGATDDLIVDGVTGYKGDFNNKQAITEKINLLLDHPEHAQVIGENASEFIRRNASIAKSAEGFLHAVLNY